MAVNSLRVSTYPEMNEFVRDHVRKVLETKAIAGGTFATKIGMNGVRFNKWLRGDHDYDMENIFKLCQFFEITVSLKAPKDTTDMKKMRRATRRERSNNLTDW